MRNKYLSELQKKLHSLNIFENWAYDYLYGNQKAAPSFGRTLHHPAPVKDDDVVGRELTHHPDGTTTVVTKFGNGRTKTELAKSGEELKAILGL
jgi:hypothetical protein